MTVPSPHPAPNVGRFTAIILGFVVFVCVAMIGGTGYLKYQLDRSEAMLAAPDTALGSDEEMFDRLRRDLGYGGFLGLVQNYVVSHDASGFSEMKAHIKSADDIIAHLPEKTPAETRHDLAAIVSIFDAMLQRISAPAGETPELTTADLTPLYAALPVLDARVVAVNGETRLAAQNKMQFWAMLLTLVSWCSLIIAAACTAGIYLTLRDKHSAPMRALAQSVQNMARGDMRTAIWGIERQDIIGELARSVDIARYHFSHLPDLSLLSEQGPVRMRFEGGSRSLFEAMMKAIARDSENIRQHASTLSEAVQEQKASITQISTKVETVLQNIMQRGQNGDTQLKQAIHDMAASAENLKNAHAHAADQLNRMLPYVQDRVQNMAEIASITGKQVAQTLQALTLSEMGLKANAEQTKDTLARLSSTADDLGERMFGAINLLQAGGKVLAETTEKIHGKLLQGDAGSLSSAASPWDAPALEMLTARLDQVAAQVSDIKNQTADVMHGRGSELADVLAQIRAKLDSIGNAPPGYNDVDIDLATPALLTGVAQLLADRVEPRLTSLERSVFTSIGKQSYAPPAEDTAGIQAQTRDALTALSDKIASLSGTLPIDLRNALHPDLQHLSTQIETARLHIEQQSRAVVVQTMDATNASRDALSGISEKLSGIERSLSPDLQHKLQDQLYQITAQIESSRVNIESIFENKIADKIVSFEQSLQATRSMIETAKQVIDAPAQISFNLPDELKKQLSDQWFQTTAQIESMRGILIESVTHQIELLESRLADKSAGPSLTRTAADYSTQRQFEQQTQILSELVATLGVLDAHMQQIKSEIHAQVR